MKNKQKPMKYSIKKSFRYGFLNDREYPIYCVIDDTGFVVDAFNLRRDAKHYCNLWNSQQKNA